MTATTNVQLGRATLGHLAIHYRPGDFALARQLFEAMGAHLEDNGPEGFCTIVFDNDDWNYVDNVLYLGQATAVKLALEAAVTEALHIGEANEDPPRASSVPRGRRHRSRSTTSASGTRTGSRSNTPCSRSPSSPAPAARSKDAPSSPSTAPVPGSTRRSTR